MAQSTNSNVTSAITTIAAASSSSTSLGRTPSDLNPSQKEFLQLLWKAYHRALVDVQPTFAEHTLSNHAYSFVLRLHSFALAFLRRQQQQALRPGAEESWVKDAGQSCLQPYARLFLGSHAARRGRGTTSTSSSSSSSLRFLTGRRVLQISCEDFLEELNQFELQGSTPTEDFLRRNSFGAFLYHVPETALAVLGCSLALAGIALFLDNHPAGVANAASTATTGPIVNPQAYCDAIQIVVRFLHIQPAVAMMDIKTGLVGKLITVKAHVVKASLKRLRVATADFACCKCGAILTHEFEGGRYSVPTKCINSSTKRQNETAGQQQQQQQQQPCKSRSFNLLRPTARYINLQELRLQEAPEESTTMAGRTPRQLELEVTNDLVDTCRPGDIVQVAAVVAAVNTAVAAGRTGKRALQETSTYKLYLKGHSITTLSESNNSNKDWGSGMSQQQRNKRQRRQQVVFTQHQLQNITALCHADHRYFGLTERRAFPFDLLVRSLCPSIIGHHEVKAGLLLCLLGGTPTGDGCVGKAVGHSIRCNSHILVVGDPGMGKSQMLLAASELAARSVYVGGNTSSTTGLTVSLTKEDKGGEAGLEAGALVLADQGVCCIDEFDKMAKNHQDGLLEAMEQQQVSIAKAGVVASLPARCSVIAAANPKHGSYNRNKTVAENLNMAKPILSRFDLVFILRDRADKDLDRMVSSNIMSLYRNNSNDPADKLHSASYQPKTTSRENNTVEDENGESRMPLSQRLAWVAEFQKQPLPADLVRDYIAYAREYCKPNLTPEAAAVLKDYFMELRYPADGYRKKDTVPITTRQLEALIRLCQARAKACLRDFVLKEDALDVVELMSQSVEQVHSDERGMIDPIRGGAGGTSNRKMKKAFCNELQRLVGVGAECTLDDLRRIADKVNCGLNEFPAVIEDLRNNGFLMKKASGNYQVLS